jgi:hypothetical protein
MHWQSRCREHDYVILKTHTLHPPAGFHDWGHGADAIDCPGAVLLPRLYKDAPMEDSTAHVRIDEH